MLDSPYSVVEDTVNSKSRLFLARNHMLTYVSLLLVAGVIIVAPNTRITPLKARRSAEPRLVSIEPLPELGDGAMCQFEPVSASGTLAAALAMQAGGPSGSDTARAIKDIDRAPARTIKDPNPAFSSIAVEPESGMLVVTDENLFRVLEYNRTENTPATARMSEPKRVIGGDLTKAEMMCGVYIDPKTLDTYIINNDTQDWLVVFSKNARGNVKPDRELAVPHGTFGISVDEGREEMYLTVQHSNSVIVYKKYAKGEDKPLREIIGNNTGLEDPHGVAADTKRNLLFVSNHGSVIATEPPARMGGRPREIIGSGRFEPPSITIFNLDANGDVKPLRTIEGPKTQLNWPMQIVLDKERGELYVANDMDHSVVVFGVEDTGDVAPRRIIRGPRTGLRNPVGITLDEKNQELLVASMGNHRALVFPLTANGDIAPKRTIRGGPADEKGLMIGNPGGVGYDTKRQQILVPN
jgi:DNA-binding beta-propeller fold protein YncE